MKAKIVVVRTFIFEIDPDSYNPEILSWGAALQDDIREGRYEDFGGWDDEISGELLGDPQEPWPGGGAGS